MVSERLYRRFYPDDRLSGTLAFYRWVRGATTPRTQLLNVGAGPPTGDATRILKGEVARVVGIDIDPVVLDNPEMDEAHVIRGDVFPIPDASFDVAVADYVLEHVERPRILLSEVHRVLLPGGSFFFRTPNRLHYVALISRLTSHRFHLRVANRARGLPSETHDPWPTFYRMNSAGRLARESQRAGFSTCELLAWEGEPFYLRFHTVPFLIGVAYERLVNRWPRLARFRANLLGRLVKGA